MKRMIILSLLGILAFLPLEKKEETREQKLANLLRANLELERAYEMNDPELIAIWNSRVQFFWNRFHEPKQEKTQCK